MTDFTHFTADGRPQMVDISDKENTVRRAVAAGQIVMASTTVHKIKTGGFDKGDVLSVAQLAGIMGAKKTSDLIPLCHPLPLTHSLVELQIDEIKNAILITAECRVTGKTGVEMEALTAIAVTALTIYDMCKSVDKNMTIENIRLLHKSGGKSGGFDAT